MTIIRYSTKCMYVLQNGQQAMKTISLSVCAQTCGMAHNVQKVTGLPQPVLLHFMLCSVLQHTTQAILIHILLDNGNSNAYFDVSVELVMIK